MYTIRENNTSLSPTIQSRSVLVFEKCTMEDYTISNGGGIYLVVRRSRQVICRLLSSIPANVKLASSMCVMSI